MWRLLVLALMVGCDGCGSGGEQTAGSEEPASPSTEQSSGAEGPAAEPEKLADVLVSVVQDPGTGHYQLSIQNHDDETVSVHQRVVVERRSGDEFTEVETEFSVRGDCESNAAECPQLAVGGEFLPPMWRGEAGQGQCDCDRCAPVEDGEYRMVVFSCERNHRYESAVFTVER